MPQLPSQFKAARPSSSYPWSRAPTSPVAPNLPSRSAFLFVDAEAIIRTKNQSQPSTGGYLPHLATFLIRALPAALRSLFQLPCSKNGTVIMPLYFLGPELWFPSVDKALPDGLLAFGGDLSVERLLLAYRSGIFPWYDPDELPLWYSPDPRFVLYPKELEVSKSMQQVLRSGKYTFRRDTCFGDVVHHCSAVPRPGQDGTWIGDDIKHAVNALHGLGYAHSAECWADGTLVGGLYGIRMGGAFFGESMFSLQPNASKFAFIHWVRLLAADGVKLIDCQVHSNHLQSLGARMIRRTEFIAQLNELL